jgi:hypothetical protein
MTGPRKKKLIEVGLSPETISAGSARVSPFEPSAAGTTACGPPVELPRERGRQPMGVDDSTTNSELVVRREGRRQVRREVTVFNLDMILAVGYRVTRRQAALCRQGGRPC